MNASSEKQRRKRWLAGINIPRYRAGSPRQIRTWAYL